MYIELKYIYTCHTYIIVMQIVEMHIIYNFDSYLRSSKLKSCLVTGFLRSKYKLFYLYILMYSTILHTYILKHYCRFVVGCGITLPTCYIENLLQFCVISTQLQLYHRNRSTLPKCII